MVTYRTAIKEDAKDIALLHAQSWQENYRGSWSDHYLDHEVIPERVAEWQKRFESNNPDQYVMLALEEGNLCGFACTYLNYDPEHGALLDNLHVSSQFHKRGIGHQLILDAATWVRQKDPNSGLFLLVLEANQAAIRFYERHNGILSEKTMYNNPDGGQSPILKYVWKDLGVFG